MTMRLERAATTRLARVKASIIRHSIISPPQESMCEDGRRSSRRIHHPCYFLSPPSLTATLPTASPPWRSWPQASAGVGCLGECSCFYLLHNLDGWHGRLFLICAFPCSFRGSWLRGRSILKVLMDINTVLLLMAWRSRDPRIGIARGTRLLDLWCLGFCTKPRTSLIRWTRAVCLSHVRPRTVAYETWNQQK